MNRQDATGSKMHIQSVELFQITLPSETEPQAREIVLVAVSDGQLTGWGEANPGTSPSEDQQWAGGAFACLRRWLAPVIIGQTIESGETLQQRLAIFRGNWAAKSALDVAVWDLLARRQGEPLWQTLGAEASDIQLGATIGQNNSQSDFLESIGAAFDAGFQNVTLKLRPGWDLEMIRAVRGAYPSETIRVDCDQCSSLDHADLFYRLEDFDLTAIEQPLPEDDLVGHAMLQESLRTAICLDQSIVSVDRMRQAIDLGSCRAVSLSPGRVGGITPALEILALCREASIPCVASIPRGALLDRNATLALSLLDGFDDPVNWGDPSESSDEGSPFLTSGFDLARDNSGPLVARLGEPSGLGGKISLDQLKSLTIDHAVIDSDS